MDRLNILILHSLGNPSYVPHFLVHQVFFLKENIPDHNYIYHDTALPLPDYVREAEFDAIILDVTFLCARFWQDQESFTDLKNSYDFVKNSKAIKIAFPQDEYDCNELLDEWMCDWSIDVVFSVISSNWDVLYPRYHRVGKIKLGYTGYVNESLISYGCNPFSQRRIDIGYRARKLLPYFGRIGEIKWTIARDVLLASQKAGLTTDIVVGDEGTLHGSAWLDFINDSKFTLGSNSGSSLLDPRGEIRRKVQTYLGSHPDAVFEEIEEVCFKGLDGKYAFTAISPRIMEAALLESCQILVEGEYSGIVQPWEHYIPILPDTSNFSDVLEAMKDSGLVSRLIKNCRDTILDTREIRNSNRAHIIIELIKSLMPPHGASSNYAIIRRVSEKYDREMKDKYAALWRRQNFRNKLVKFVDDRPVLSRVIRTAQSFAKKRKGLYRV